MAESPPLPDVTADESGEVSFATDILPLFRPMDIQCMRGRTVPVFLADYDYMKQPANAAQVLSYLKGESLPQMPFGGPFWEQDALDLFQAWIDGGLKP